MSYEPIVRPSGKQKTGFKQTCPFVIPIGPIRAQKKGKEIKQRERGRERK